MFGWPWFDEGKGKEVVVSKQAVQRSIFISSGLTYKAELDETEYLLVPGRDWVLKNCPRSKAYSTKWDCTKIAIAALAKLQTHAVGAIKVDWPNTEKNHALLIVAYVDGTAELFDPYSRHFYSAAGRKIFKLWM